MNHSTSTHKNPKFGTDVEVSLFELEVMDCFDFLYNGPRYNFFESPSGHQAFVHGISGLDSVVSRSTRGWHCGALLRML